MEFEIVDRYSALGMAPPHPLTACHGQCEGTGFVPCRVDDPDLTPEERRRMDAVRAQPDFDGDDWAFIRCVSCDGTGKVPLWRGIWRLPGYIIQFLRVLRRASYYGFPEESVWEPRKRICQIYWRNLFPRRARPGEYPIRREG